MLATNKRKRAHARTMAPAKQSTAATIRNIPSHNAIVIMQTTQPQNDKQQKRDNANNTNVILLCSPSRHNGIVISPSRRQAFVTFRNISSAYLSHRLSLYSTPVLLCLYAHMRISPYRYMIICGNAHNENDSHSQERGEKSISISRKPAVP